MFVSPHSNGPAVLLHLYGAQRDSIYCKSTSTLNVHHIFLLQDNPTKCSAFMQLYICSSLQNSLQNETFKMHCSSLLQPATCRRPAQHHKMFILSAKCNSRDASHPVQQLSFCRSHFRHSSNLSHACFFHLIHR